MSHSVLLLLAVLSSSLSCCDFPSQSRYSANDCMYQAARSFEKVGEFGSFDFELVARVAFWEARLLFSLLNLVFIPHQLSVYLVSAGQQRGPQTTLTTSMRLCFKTKP
ncbi:hypothetical protein N657DRAFT_622335 [Parathielavia appendiculata]|uniref:Secreted protein n=1 Tax=Parathielavia appendiculata TaxID=2587402 RepID=A0AAN6TWF3_9PEZI|nr:hypothetical protein N657DRAFT_622335 [Parathielavia appendiculata]